MKLYDLFPPLPPVGLNNSEAMEWVENFKKEQKKDMCGMRDGCDNPAADEMHPCPFAEEIYDDASNVCQCCPDCTQECAWDI